MAVQNTTTPVKPVSTSHLRRAKRTLVVLSLALASCQASLVPTSPTPTLATIRILSEPGTTPLLRELAANYHTPDTLIAWEFEEADWSTLQSWLSEGRASFALTGYFPTQSPMWATPIGENGLAVVVNQANPVGSLSTDDLRAIFAGRTINWQALRGANQPIVAISRPDGSSSAGLIRTLILGDRPVTGGAELALSDDMVIADVQADHGAIGYLSIAALKLDANGIDRSTGLRAVAIDGQLPTLTAISNHSYPLRAPIAFYGPNPPANDLYNAFFAWVQGPQGQAIVAQYYAPLGK